MAPETPIDESRVRCLHCRRYRFEHNATTRACPVWAAKRIVGHTTFHPLNRFSPNPRSKPAAPKFTL